MAEAAASSPDVAPFIIWTQRRTGGTTLTALLTRCSGLEAWQDEAFNVDRQHGAISRAYQADGDDAALEAPVSAVLAQGRILKHCLETVPWGVTRALLRRSQAMGYRHILLLRRDETQRLLSLVLAELTGAWGPEDAPARYRDLATGRTVLPPVDLHALRAQINADASYLGHLMRAFLAGGIPYYTLFYEDLFTGAEAARRQHFAALAHHLRLRARPADDPLVREALMERSQETRTIHGLLPNLRAAIAVIEAET
jgi:LPS sulfotransferase NodH